MVANLTGKTALVTGASSGMGLATAKHFAKLGARVALVARRTAIIEDLATSIGGGAIAVTADVTDDRNVSAAVDSAWAALEGIDYVVHAAGIVEPAPLEDLTPELWRKHIDANLSGAFYVMRDCGLRMRERGSGSIVNIGSDLSFIGLQSYAHYCATKAGVAGLTKAMAMELAPTVRVNCVCPGAVDTPMLDAELEWFGGTPDVRENMIARVPLKRIATPEEIANFITFVAVEATFATGSTLAIDGGSIAM